MLIFCPKKVEDVKSVDDGDVVLDKYSEVINNELEVAISWLSVKDWEARVFFKLESSLKSKTPRKGLLCCSCYHFRLGGINFLAKKEVYDVERVHGGDAVLD